MIIRVHTDGGSRGNPGPSATGYIIESDGKILKKGGTYIGVSTNNTAEYSAVIEAFEALGEIPVHLQKGDRIEFYLDSQLVVSQLHGVYKVKHAHLRELLTRIHILESGFSIPVEYFQIPRSQNSKADSLVNYYLNTELSSR